MDETPKRGRGRPVGTGKGKTPVRTLRFGSLWDQAETIAKGRGEAMTDVVSPAIERALRRYVKQHEGNESEGNQP